MTRVNQSHILITGGGTTPKWNRRSSSSYLYSEETGFTKIEDMKTPRIWHGCSVINDSTVIVAGGQEDDDDDDLPEPQAPLSPCRPAVVQVIVQRSAGRKRTAHDATTPRLKRTRRMPAKFL